MEKHNYKGISSPCEECGYALLDPMMHFEADAFLEPYQQQRVQMIPNSAASNKANVQYQQDANDGKHQPFNYDPSNTPCPDHYNKSRITAVEVIHDWNLDFFLGNVIKYIYRHKFKHDSKTDLSKAAHYLAMEREILTTGKLSQTALTSESQTRANSTIPH